MTETPQDVLNSKNALELEQNKLVNTICGQDLTVTLARRVSNTISKGKSLIRTKSAFVQALWPYDPPPELWVCDCLFQGPLTMEGQFSASLHQSVCSDGCSLTASEAIQVRHCRLKGLTDLTGAGRHELENIVADNILVKGGTSLLVGDLSAQHLRVEGIPSIRIRGHSNTHIDHLTVSLGPGATTIDLGGGKHSTGTLHIDPSANSQLLILAGGRLAQSEDGGSFKMPGQGLAKLVVASPANNCVFPVTWIPEETGKPSTHLDSLELGPQAVFQYSSNGESPLVVARATALQAMIKQTHLIVETFASLGAVTWNGGALHLLPGAKCKLTDSTLEGIKIEIATGAKLDLERCRLNNCSLLAKDGAGFYPSHSHIRDLTLS